MIDQDIYSILCGLNVLIYQIIDSLFIYLDKQHITLTDKTIFNYTDMGTIK